MTKQLKIFVIIAALILFALGLTVYNSGLDRYTPTDRAVTLLDVGFTVESIKSNKLSAISGLFLDQSTGLAFFSPIDMNTLTHFKAGANQELNMVRSFNLDTVNGSVLGRVLMFFGIASCFLGSTFICVVIQYTMDDRSARKKKELNNRVTKSD